MPSGGYRLTEKMMRQKMTWSAFRPDSVRSERACLMTFSAEWARTDRRERVATRSRRRGSDRERADRLTGRVRVRIALVFPLRPGLTPAGGFCASFIFVHFLDYRSAVHCCGTSYPSKAFRRGTSLSGEIALDHAAVMAKFSGGAGHHDSASLKHMRVIGYIESQERQLLDQEDRETVIGKGAQRLKD